uniref:Uncharacterized protein n=1 Tax=Arundo donax TaxID=35708 RepID=A0A0A9G7M2_ARUDO
MLQHALSKLKTEQVAAPFFSQIVKNEKNIIIGVRM